MKTFIDWLLGRERTVESIVASYVRTVEDLVSHAEQKAVEAAEHAETIAITYEKKVAAEVEATKAKVLAAKLGDLFN